MYPFFRFLLASVFAIMLIANLTEVKAQQDNWTHFRGTNLNGISEDSLVPVSWNNTTNVIWKTNIRGKGWVI
jgi:outer membrane protein assembly factor BamB